MTPNEADGLRELARRLRPLSQELAERMLATYRAEIPQYARIEDPHVLNDMAAVSRAALERWLDVLEEYRPVDREFMRPLLEAIRRREAQGVGMDAMMRAYRIAPRVMWREMLELGIAPELMGPLSTLMLEFTDRVTTVVEQEYAAQALTVPVAPDPGRSALFEEILCGPPLRDYPGVQWLAEPHCVVIVAAPEPGESGSGAGPLSLDDLAGALVREARASAWTTRVRSVIATCPIPEVGGRDALVRRLARFTNASRPLSVAVGGVAEGLQDVRTSYHEALEALRIGERLTGPTGSVHDSQELAPLAILVAEPDRAKRFARGCLHPLGRLVDRGWVLPTLAAYLKCQGSLKEAAAELAVHPSTVKYRLNELRPFLNAHAADGDQATTLLLGIRVCEYFARAEPPR